MDSIGNEGASRNVSEGEAQGDALLTEVNQLKDKAASRSVSGGAAAKGILTAEQVDEIVQGVLNACAATAPWCEECRTVEALRDSHEALRAKLAEAERNRAGCRACQLMRQLCKSEAETRDAIDAAMEGK